MKTKWKICSVCRGDGKVVNPNIDAHGLTAEDFYDDPDFAENYRSGSYDITCAACHGSGKMRPGDLERLREAAEDRRLAAREDGDYEGYMVVGDYRYGY